MKNNQLLEVLRSILIFTTLCCSNIIGAQEHKTNEFWENVQFGGNIGLGIGSDHTDISIAPSAIYNFNEFVALGLGVQYAYAKQKNDFTSNLYGGSVIALFNPIEEIQLSTELEQLRVNVDFGVNSGSQNYWNTGLFLGAGYRNGNMTIGARYDVLHKDNKNAFSEAFMPFVRVYF